MDKNAKRPLVSIISIPFWLSIPGGKDSPLKTTETSPPVVSANGEGAMVS